MRAYFDTSVIVALLVEELGSAACETLWREADDVATCRIAYAEAAAALAQACRLGRLSDLEFVGRSHALATLWEQFVIIEVDQALVERAARHAETFGLRGYDAVHCVAAAQLQPGIVAASGDRALLAAWHELGLATFDSNQ